MAIKTDANTVCSFLITSYPFISAAVLLHFIKAKTKNTKYNLPVEYWILLFYIGGCVFCGILLKMRIKVKLTCFIFSFMTVSQAAAIHFIGDRFRYSSGSKFKLAARSYGIIATYVTFVAITQATKITNQLKILSAILLSFYSLLSAMAVFFDPIYTVFTRKLKLYTKVNLSPFPSWVSMITILFYTYCFLRGKNHRANTWILISILFCYTFIPELWVLIRGYKQEIDYWFAWKCTIDSLVPLLGFILLNQRDVHSSKNQ